jgi:L-malate glycosyltransferase
MKVLVISNMYPNKKNPSYGVFVKNFVIDLKKNSTKVDLVAIKGKEINLFLKLIHYVRFLIISMIKLMYGNYDLIYVHYISHSIIPLILLRPLIRKPYILNAHGEDVLLNKPIEKIIDRWSRKTILTASLIVVPSNHYRNILLNRYGNIRVFTSPSGGFNNKIFYPYEYKTKKQELFTIGFISRIEKGKGWKTLLQTMRILNDKSIKIKLQIIGIGSETHLLENEIKRKNLNSIVHFLGPKKQAELGKYYRKFDLFIFPTELDESLGLVGIESMACGTPVIGSNIPSINSYLEHEVNGLLFEPGNSEDLADKILFYMDLPIERKKTMHESCVQMTKKYSNTIVMNELYSEINFIYQKSLKKVL